MPPSNKLVVADTGPLIALARLELLALLPELFDQVLLTPTVLNECEAKSDCGEGVAIRAAVDAGRLELIAPREARIAGLTISQMIDELGRRRIPVVRYTPDELAGELDYVRTLADC